MNRAQRRTKTTDPHIDECPHARAHKIPNRGEFTDGRKTTTIPRSATGGTGLFDLTTGKTAVRFRCILGHEWVIRS